MVERIWSPKLLDLQRDVIENTPQITTRTLCIYCIEGARCLRHWPSRIGSINGTQCAFNDTTQSMKYPLDELGKQSKQHLLESDFHPGFAGLQSIRISKLTSPPRFQNKPNRTISMKSLINGITTRNTNNEKTLEIEEVFLPPKKPEVTDRNSRQKYQRFREKKFICEHCGNTFTLKHNMQTHIANYHTGEGKTLRPRGKRYKCLKCGWICRTINEVKTHQKRVHDAPKEKCHICDLCDKNFRSNGLMREHYSTVHLNERPYECTICMTKFGRKGGLRRHSIMKHSDFVYACPYEECTHPGFKCSKALTAHIRSIHTHIRPYKCGQCEKSFVRRNDLRTHEALHSATLQYICGVCGQKFKRASYLKRHSKIRHEQHSTIENRTSTQIQSFYSNVSTDTDRSKTTPDLSCSPRNVSTDTDRSKTTPDFSCSPRNVSSDTVGSKTTPDLSCSPRNVSSDTDGSKTTPDLSCSPRNVSSDTDGSKMTPDLSCSPLISLSVDKAIAVISSDWLSCRQRFSRSLFQ